MARARKSRNGGRPDVLQHYRYLPFKIGEISNRLTRGASRLYLKHFGVGGLEWRIIAMLAMEGNVSASVIVSRVSLNKGAVSRGLAHLLKLGLITARDDPEHGRRRFIALTAKGARLHDKLLQVALGREQLLIARLTKREVDVLLDLLDRLEAQLDAVDAYDPSIDK